MRPAALRPSFFSTPVGRNPGPELKAFVFPEIAKAIIRDLNARRAQIPDSLASLGFRDDNYISGE